MGYYDYEEDALGPSLRQQLENAIAQEEALAARGTVRTKTVPRRVSSSVGTVNQPIPFELLEAAAARLPEEEVDEIEQRWTDQWSKDDDGEEDSEPSIATSQPSDDGEDETEPASLSLRQELSRLYYPGQVGLKPPAARPGDEGPYESLAQSNRPDYEEPYGKASEPVLVETDALKQAPPVNSVRGDLLAAVANETMSDVSPDAEMLRYALGASQGRRGLFGNLAAQEAAARHRSEEEQLQGDKGRYVNTGHGTLFDTLTGKEVSIKAYREALEHADKLKTAQENLDSLNNLLLELMRGANRQQDADAKARLQADINQVNRERTQAMRDIANINAEARKAPKTLNVQGFSKETAGVAQTRADFRQTQYGLDNYRELLRGFDPRSYHQLSPDKRAEIETAYNDMIVKMKDLAKLGALTGPDFDLMKSIITPPTSLKGALYGQEALQKQLDQVQKIIDRANKSYAEQFGPTKTPPPGAASTPSARTLKPGDVVDGYRFKGGNPQAEQNWELQK